MSDRPNILFLFADQMHAFAMGCMGTEDIHTPHLDKLAREGVLFRNCYSNAPVCTPFRATLISGQYGSQTDTLRNGRYIPEGTRTLAGALNDAGYRTGWVGSGIWAQRVMCGYHPSCGRILRSLSGISVITIFCTV